MDHALLQAAANLGAALLLGALIGFERQWRQRMAGLRTNTLVALGAAGFVVFAASFPEEVSPTRVAAQVVSGIGFLGAGIIFREGFNVRGLNTAATLWCSAAVGLMAGAGRIELAALLTGMIVVVNVLLRPIVARINRQPADQTELPRAYRVALTCRSDKEARVRAMLLQGLASSGLHLTELDSRDVEDADRVQIVAEVQADGASDAALEQIVGRLSLEPVVTSARWRLTVGEG
ncbi:MAG: MgtC/SapB family protein [Rubrimonas sp.]